MGDVILRFEMRTMKLDGFAWCLKSDVDKLARHHQQQVIEGNLIREKQRDTIEQKDKLLLEGVAVVEKLRRSLADALAEVESLMLEHHYMTEHGAELQEEVTRLDEENKLLKAKERGDA